MSTLSVIIASVKGDEVNLESLLLKAFPAGWFEHSIKRRNRCVDIPKHSKSLIIEAWEPKGTEFGNPFVESLGDLGTDPVMMTATAASGDKMHYIPVIGMDDNIGKKVRFYTPDPETGKPASRGRFPRESLTVHGLARELMNFPTGTDTTVTVIGDRPLTARFSDFERFCVHVSDVTGFIGVECGKRRDSGHYMYASRKVIATHSNEERQFLRRCLTSTYIPRVPLWCPPEEDDELVTPVNLEAHGRGGDAL